MNKTRIDTRYTNVSGISSSYLGVANESWCNMIICSLESELHDSLDI